jgi:hypothetical protein
VGRHVGRGGGADDDRPGRSEQLERISVVLAVGIEWEPVQLAVRASHEAVERDRRAQDYVPHRFLRCLILRRRTSGAKIDIKLGSGARPSDQRSARTPVQNVKIPV